ncbi:hypothetical protein LR48_Vigan02g071300 [Vigna angularis]|uniref:Uncharacterized protein n=1 Tax=Phaseolus angularis TaxID=3914 RepID=A0A0L9TVE7_PHAAN|nr:hypothetical protein LR48_Vigan02g071300 [Vigna angularis]
MVSGGSKASKHNIKAQIQYNPLRFQQSPFNSHYKNTERGATYEESNKSYVVKAVTVPSSESESEASNSKNIVDSVKNFMAAVYQFIYPYALYGQATATISASLVAVEKLSDISPLVFIGLLQAVLPHSFMVLYANGVNQVFDFEIDKLPFLRWKQYPVMASLLIFVCGTFINPIAYFLHMQTFVLKRPLVFTRSFIVFLLFMSFYSPGIALAKDIPDVEGDIKHGVDSFAARLGQKNIFWICVFLLEMAFGVAFLAGASSSSHFWIKIVTTKYVDVTNPASTRSFYSLIWKTELYPTFSSCFPFFPSLLCFAPSHPIVLPILSLSLLFDVSLPLPLSIACVRWHCNARVHLLNLPCSCVRVFLPPLRWRWRQEGGPLISRCVDVTVKRVLVFVKGGS